MQVDNLTCMKNKKLKVCNNVSTSVKELEEMVKVEKVTSHLRQRGAVDQIGNGRKACANFSHFGFSAKKGGEVENSQYILQCPGWCQTYQNLNRKFVRLCQTQLQRERGILCKKQIDLGREMEKMVVQILDKHWSFPAVMRCWRCNRLTKSLTLFISSPLKTPGV